MAKRLGCAGFQAWLKEYSVLQDTGRMVPPKGNSVSVTRRKKNRCKAGKTADFILLYRQMCFQTMLLGTLGFQLRGLKQVEEEKGVSNPFSLLHFYVFFIPSFGLRFYLKVIL